MNRGPIRATYSYHFGQPVSCINMHRTRIVANLQHFRQHRPILLLVRVFVFLLSNFLILKKTFLAKVLRIN